MRQMYDSEVKFINFTGLAKKYDMKNKEGNIPGNGGQVVKEFLIENGIDSSSFNYKSKDRNNENTRRCKRKIKGTSISLPCDPTNVKVKKELKRMVHEGNYSLGELIVPQKYKKVVLNDDLSLFSWKENIPEKHQKKNILNIRTFLESIQIINWKL